MSVLSKTVMTLGLCGIAFAVLPSPASAAPIPPLSKSAISGPSDVVDVRWRQCRRDRWGRVICRWCWRDRWGRVICR